MSNHNDKNLLNSGEAREGNPEPSLKECNTCNQSLNLKDFHISKSNSDGRNHTCKRCRSEKARDNYKKDYFSNLFRLKKAECKKKGITFDLTAEYLRELWTDACPITGEKLSFAHKKGFHYLTANLDRIIPDMGYTQGNVVFISGRMNRIKYNASIEELELLISWLRKVQRLS